MDMRQIKQQIRDEFDKIDYQHPVLFADDDLVMLHHVITVDGGNTEPAAVLFEDSGWGKLVLWTPEGVRVGDNYVSSGDYIALSNHFPLPDNADAMLFKSCS